MNYTIEHPLAFEAETDFKPELIAASTSKLCRFAGRCKFFYSVAQHMGLVAHIAGRLMNRTFDREKKDRSHRSPITWHAERYKRAKRYWRVVLMAHLHDSIEHLTGDIITPVKKTLTFSDLTTTKEFREKHKDLFQWEYVKLNGIYNFHGIDPTLYELNVVKIADKYALSYELMAMMDWEHLCWQEQLKEYPVTMFDGIEIQRSTPEQDEYSWLEDYNNIVARLNTEDTVIL